ncbi:hypothetical protein QUC31_016079 [Theobroma cacao]
MCRVTQETKPKAEVYYGDETCREKFTSLLEAKGLPNGLLTLQDIQECGYVKDTGFVWLRHKKKTDSYKFKDVVISYDNEITAYFEPNKIKNLTGVKAKEFMIWVTLTHLDRNLRRRISSFSIYHIQDSGRLVQIFSGINV